MALHAKAADPLEEVGREERHELGDKSFVFRRVVRPARLARRGPLQRIGLLQMLGGAVVVALGVQHVRQAVVQQGPLAVGQLRVRDQLPLRSDVLRRKPAAEDLHQLVMCEDEAGVVAQGGAEGVFSAAKIADRLQRVAQVIIRLGVICFAATAPR